MSFEPRPGLKFPLLWDPSHFDGAYKFQSPKKQEFLGLKFARGGYYTFLLRPEHYALVTASSHYEVVRDMREYQFDRARVSLECSTDARMVDHLVFTVKIPGSFGSAGDVNARLEMIRDPGA